MDSFKIREEIKALKTIGEYLEQTLNHAGFEACDLPEDILGMLDKFVEIQINGVFNDLNLNYLREFYFTKKREDIECKQIVSQQLSALKRVEHLTEETVRHVADLERFTKTISERSATDSALQQNIVQIGGKSKALLDRQKSFKLPDDFNVESLIEKINLLERNK